MNVPDLDHHPEDPDELSFNIPDRPSQLIALDDDDMWRLLRKVAFANQWAFDTKVRFEAEARLISALKDFKRSSDRTGRWLIGLTIALVALTVILVVLTITIVWLTTQLD